MADVTLTAAVLAGILSFLSPCVLPLVPPYLCFLAGTTIEEFAEGGERRGAARRDHRRGPVRARLFDRLRHARRHRIRARAGHPAVSRYALDRRRGSHHHDGLALPGSFPAALPLPGGPAHCREAGRHVGCLCDGARLAFGWTPCIGPILAAILAVAGSEDTGCAAPCFSPSYSAGLGIPFLLAALALESFTGFMRRFRKRMGLVEKTMGALLVVTGVAVPHRASRRCRSGCWRRSLRSGAWAEAV